MTVGEWVGGKSFKNSPPFSEPPDSFHFVSALRVRRSFCSLGSFPGKCPWDCGHRGITIFKKMVAQISLFSVINNSRLWSRKLDLDLHIHISEGSDSFLKIRATVFRFSLDRIFCLHSFWSSYNFSSGFLQYSYFSLNLCPITNKQTAPGLCAMEIFRQIRVISVSICVCCSISYKILSYWNNHFYSNISDKRYFTWKL